MDGFARTSQISRHMVLSPPLWFMATEAPASSSNAPAARRQMMPHAAAGVRPPLHAAKMAPNALFVVAHVVRALPSARTFTRRVFRVAALMPAGQV